MSMTEVQRRSKPKPIVCLRCRVHAFGQKAGEACQECGTRLPSKADLDLVEKETQKQCVDFMVFRQWLAFRNNPLLGMIVGTQQAVASCKPGTPDYRFAFPFGTHTPVCLNLWVEFKKVGEELDPKQVTWHQYALKRGEYIWVIDNFAVFEKRYQETFSWLHTGKFAVGQYALLFNDLPEVLRPHEMQ